MAVAMTASTPTPATETRITLRPPTAGRDDVRPGFSSAVLLKLDDSVLDGFKRAAEARERLQFLTGSTPKLRIGSRSIDLTLAPDAFRNELYASTTGTSASDFSFRALLTHRAAVGRLASPAHNDDANTDLALATLQNTIALHEQQKQANSTNITDSLLPAPASRFDAARKEKLDRRRRGLGGANQNTQQAGRRPPLGHATPQPSGLGAAAEALGESGARLKAMRLSVVHLLAPGPASTDEVRYKTHIPSADLNALLPKVAKESDGRWQLTDRAYKEVDVWAFKYATQQKRQAAIDAAVRAYDRLRLGTDDRLWQLLLPVKDRDTGIVLSRLHFNNGSAAADSRRSLTPKHATSPNGPAAATGAGAKAAVAATTVAASPGLGPSTPRHAGTPADVKKRLLSKNPQKARAAEEAKEKKRREREEAAIERGKEKEKEKPARKPVAKKVNPKIKSAEFVSSSEDNDDDDAEEGEVRETKPKPAATKAKAGAASSDSSETPLQKIRATAAGKPKPQARVSAAGAIQKPAVSPNKAEARKPPISASTSKPLPKAIAKPGQGATTGTPSSQSQLLHRRTPSAQLSSAAARARDGEGNTPNGQRAHPRSPLKGVAIPVSGKEAARKRQDTVTSTSDSARGSEADKKIKTATSANIGTAKAGPRSSLPNGTTTATSAAAAGVKRRITTPGSHSSSPTYDAGGANSGSGSSSNKLRRTDDSPTVSAAAQNQTSRLASTAANNTSARARTKDSPPTPRSSSANGTATGASSHRQSNNSSERSERNNGIVGNGIANGKKSTGKATKASQDTTTTIGSGSGEGEGDNEDNETAGEEPMLHLNFDQGLKKARQFRDRYYPAYAALYDKLEARRARGEIPSPVDVERLWRMHTRLEQMKREIVLASSRA